MSPANHKHYRRKKLLAAVLGIGALAVAASACTPTGVVVGAGATFGVAAFQDRPLAVAAKDTRITVAILEAWFRADHTLSINIGVEVYEGRALLTGAVDDPVRRANAVRLAWKIDGVRDVLNEIQINKGNVLNLARDSWITAQLKLALTLDDRIMAINYETESVNGTVYLIGIAQSQAELDRVIAHARKISYVRDVISHVRIKVQVDQ